MKELKSEREQFEKENHGVISDKKLLEEERVDNGECKKHRETPSRLQKESQIEKDKKVNQEPKEYLLGTEEVSVEECCFKKGKRVLTDKDQEAVKECYKEYIGMVKIYYEEAKRSRHGEPGDVAVNCRGTAGKERPQADARIDAEVEEMLDGTPRKKSRTARDDVKMEGNKNKRRNSRNFCGGTTQREETRLVRVRVNRGTARKERPQADARIDAEVEEMLDETPRKRSKTEKEDVNMEDVNSGGNYEATIHEKVAGTSSSDDFIIIT
ncbi:hypothetical protein Tco_1569314 [Tanacetum coccineum]